MGLLAAMKKNDLWVGYPIVFWALVGLVLAGAFAALTWLDAGGGYVLVAATTGGLIGIAIGMYAAMGSSRLARILAVPSVILMFFWP